MKKVIMEIKNRWKSETPKFFKYIIKIGLSVSGVALAMHLAVIGAGAKVASGARVTGSVVLEGSEIGADAVIENSIIGPGVNVAARGTVGNEVLGKNEIGETVNA